LPQTGASVVIVTPTVVVVEVLLVVVPIVVVTGIEVVVTGFVVVVAGVGDRRRPFELDVERRRRDRCVRWRDRRPGGSDPVSSTSRSWLSGSVPVSVTV